MSSVPIELSERFAGLVKFLDDKGGRYQRQRVVFAAEVGLTEHQLRILTKRAVELGILDIVSQGPPMIGLGRFPNEYVLRLTYERFMETRFELHGHLEARRQDAKLGDRRATRRTQAQRRAAKAKVPSDTVVPPPADLDFEDLGDPDSVDVGAWQDFSDF